MTDLISRQEAYDVLTEYYHHKTDIQHDALRDAIDRVPSASPDRSTDDDFETIRIHLNAHKEQLCNQQRWKEAEEYQRIIDRFMAFASAEPESSQWIPASERLPEEGERAILRYSNGKISGGTYIGSRTWDVDFGDTDPAVSVVEWRPER